MKWKNFILLLIVSMVSAGAEAQDKTDFMRENGRLYVVVAVMVTILLGLILYLVRLDRKMSRLERDK